MIVKIKNENVQHKKRGWATVMRESPGAKLGGSLSRRVRGKGNGKKKLISE